jgi:hypothetical protein
MMKIGNEDILTNAPFPRLDYLLSASTTSAATTQTVALVAAIVRMTTEKQES